MSAITEDVQPSRVLRWDAAVSCVLLFAAGTFLVLAMIGAVRFYSPVPFWDMWDGYVLYYINAQRLDFLEMTVAQANEHRDILSRLLFWLDIGLFGGRSLLLVPANIALLAASWLVLCAAAYRLLPDRSLWATICLAVAPLYFSWLQKDNIVVGYQSQFIFAYLIPFLSVFCLAMAPQARRPTSWFVAALTFAVMSLGAMANGLLAGPVLLVMLLLMRAPRAWIAATVVVGAAATAAWFYRYVFIPHPSSGVVDQALFTLSFLGSPFGTVSESHMTGRIAGGVLIFISSWLAFDWLRGMRRDPLMLALLMFIAFVGASGLMTAMGRAGWTENATGVGRYLTPGLFVWATLLVAVAARFKDAASAPIAFGVVGVVTAVGLFPAQMQVFDENARFEAHGKVAGALALLMDVRDYERVGSIYPVESAEQRKHIFGLVEFMAPFGVSIFSEQSGYIPAIRRIGALAPQGLRSCEGVIELTEEVPGEPRFRRLAGWAYDQSNRDVPTFAYIVADGTVDGVAATGLPRADVVGIYGKKARDAGFVGYVRAGAADAYTVMCAE